MGKLKRSIIVVTLVSFLITTMPFQVLAQDANTDIGKTEVSETKKKEEVTEAERAAVKILEEVEEKRESNIKHYLLEDKTYEAVIYNYPVHYFENGKWKDIDNTLSETIDKSSVVEEPANKEEFKEVPKVEEKKADQGEGKQTPNSEIKASEAENQETPKPEVKTFEGEKKEKPKSEDKTATKSQEKEVPKGEEKTNTKAEDTKDKASSQNNGQGSDKENKSSSQEEKNNSNKVSKDNESKGSKDSILNFGKSKEKEAEKVFENKSNSFKFKLAKSGDSKRLVTISKDKYEIAWSLENAAKVTGQLSEYNEDKINKEIEEKASGLVDSSKNASLKSKSEKESEKKNIVENEKKKTLSNITSGVNFKNILKDVDLNYQLISDKVKENLILNKNIKDSTFTYNIEVKNLIAVKQEDNSVIFYDKNDKSKEVFLIKAPFMFDSKGAESKDIQVKVEETKKGYSLTLIPSKEWLNDKGRAYPVTIDPDVETELGRDKITDTFVTSVADPENKYNNQYLRVGNHSTIGTTRSFIKFTLPTITSAEMIVGAQLDLYLREAPVENEINVHRVTSNWNADASNNLTWNSQPSFSPEIEDYNIVSGSDKWVSWDVTEIAKSWYITGNNYGLMLKSTNESTTNTAFWSSDVHDAYQNARPKVKIKYISNSGLENYWTYHSQSAGRAGTGYVNDYNGNLIHIHDDITMTGSRNPITVQHVYNSNNLGYDSTKPWMGRGWNLNVYQWLTRENIGGTLSYKYTDGDGTVHYFKDTGAAEIKDDLNLGYTITTDSTGYRYITDKNNNKIKFYSDNNGSLHSFTDRNGNTTTTTWTKYNEVWCITELKDAAGRSVKLDYVNNGYLTSITDASGLKTQFTLTNYDNDLSKITYPDGNSSEFFYNSSFYLYWAKNIDGFSSCYHYTTNSPYRVKAMYEWNDDGLNKGGVYGKQVNIQYGNNTTTFTDVQGRKETYQFDLSGQTISVKDAEDKAEYYEYNDETNRKKLGQSSKLQSTVLNYLQDHDAEIGKEWYPFNNLATYTTEEKYIGSKSLRIHSDTKQNETYFGQFAKLSKGKTYTFSGYIKTKNVTEEKNSGAALTISYKDVNGQWQYERVYVNGTKDWERYEKSVTLPSNISDESIWFAVELLNSGGTAYFDSLQLEEGSFANRYNLIENPDFNLWDQSNNKPLYWISNSFTDPSDYVDYGQGVHPRGMSTMAMKISGKTKAGKGIFQNLSISGKKGDVYVLGGWAYANPAPLRDYRLFQLDLGFVKNDGSIYWKKVPFNDDVSDWQYASKEIIAPEDYKSLQVYISYYQNIGVANFDGIQLYKEEFGTSYQYDSKGNVVSTEDLAKQNANFEYSTNNDLTKSVDPKGNSFKYEYDNGNAALKNHNLTKATSAENVVYSFQYDNGNPIKATVGTVGVGAMFIQSDATYSANKNYIKTVTDASGNTVTFNYDETKGTLNSVVDSNSKPTNYSYDPKTNNLTSVSKVTNTDNVTVENKYSYDKDKIKTITHNKFNYQFNYDLMGNNTEVLVGSQRLILNYFKERNGVLDKSVYGNNQSVSYSYDNVDRVTGKKYDGDTANRYTYSYDAEGNLAQKTDNSNNISYRYNYDISGKLMNIKESNGDNTRFAYDKNNNTNAVIEKVKGNNYNTSYGYDKDNRLKNITYSRSTLATSLNEKLIAQYNFNSKDATDTSGKGYDGIIYGTPTFVDTKRGQGIKLNGLDQWVKLPEFTPSSSYTVSAFLQPEEAKTMSFLNKVDDTGLVNKLWFGIMGSGYSVQINTPEYIVGTATTDYQHIVATIEKKSASTSNVTIYKNGVALGSTTLNSTADAMGGKGWNLGQDIDGTNLTDFFKGIIDEVSIYNGVLSQNEINSISNDNYYVNKAYDALGRLTTSTINNNFTTKYSYKEGKTVPTTAGSTAVSSTNRISSIENKGNKIIYDYDKNGNIKTIDQGGKVITYYYNELNELIREDNQVTSKTAVYSYDMGGNITSKKEYEYTAAQTITTAKISDNSYTYTDANWKDKLMFYNEKAIDYDLIGNPKSYYTKENQNDVKWNLMWEAGRQLKEISNGAKTITYKYNDSGIRTEKVVGGIKTTYHLAGDKVTFESNGTDNVYYTYDSAGKLVSMNISTKISETSWSTPTEYFYVRNAQGDIIGLIDKAGTQVVSYNYDSWGRMTPSKAEMDDASDTSKNGITGTLKDTVGVKNPYRYRGYRYDTETGLYYLQSRYYNPEWGRFINADGITGVHGELLSHNMFAYCANEPINRHDPSGFIWDFMDIGMAALSWADFAKKPSMGGLALAVIDTVACAPVVPSTGYFRRGAQVADKVSDGIKVVSKADNIIKYSNLDDGLNFSNKALKHMGESGRQVPIQTLQDAIRYGEGLPDPRGSSATMYYTTMTKTGKLYNLEVLYDKASNTVYHFEYARKAMGNLPQIKK